MNNPLSGKVALVTGGSRSIGAAIVRCLAEDGASVAFTYSASAGQAIALAEAINAGSNRAIAIKADSARPEEIQAAVASTIGAFGRIDILVNNAGILIPGKIDQYDLADFDRMVAVNVRAVFVAVQAAQKHMRPGGRIITIGSVTAERSGFAGSSVYSMTKGAVASLTRGLARDLGPRGITINNVQPGPTATDMNPTDGPNAGHILPLMALGRLGQDVEIASFVSYLASPEASFVTGASLTIDGGYLA